jgi:DNA-binding LytR/AlgR family response regulator
MKKLTCLIVDDEPNAIGLLTSYIEKVPYLELRHSCYDAVEALAYLREHPVDLVFLDIEMHEMNGMELASLLNRDIKIIFTTAYSQYAVESYERNAVDYLLKPITFKRFMQAIVKLTEKNWPSEPAGANNIPADDSTFFKTGRAMIKVSYASIIFFEAQKEYAAVITETEKILIYKRMKDLEKELPNTFQRIHHSFIVNLRHIKKIEDNHVWIGNRKLSISEKYRSDFLKKLKTF